MIRFIFVCMTLVALSILTISGQYMLDGINTAKESLEARNTVNAVDAETAAATPDGITFEEIYATGNAAPAADLANATPEELNNLEAAAGEDTFSAGFTDKAPKALADDETVSGPFPDATLSTDNTSN